ncbi:chalcone isomerase family protein [Vibrio parahaemolyticus]|uniref:chalcone isomerase family protein n=1 Tax=Vibrio parahaemolyticus TaxID=670 RepID=UPI0004F258DE|nr:chalcone isomerase family protein [Vibrio parahaemolyticus]EJG0948164.1 chalcone isomerase family protein [Vibrio parahaemolyticus O1:K58]EHK0031519.1 chalcone isomerase family protein [Vibrio parahaemolyticus]EHK0035940.1 chalcone isomerase family protein [Vibrio parahaemolyticus]EHK0035983.1 chalcone isomerase family protein [Vibrio parahaemolyticus]EHR1134035.1 chalcone isomerase family protein [Vibrio parahaemolyticus]
MASLKRKLLRGMGSGILFVFAVGAIPSQAQDIGSTDRLNVENWQEWETVGEAQLTWFVFDIYRSRLKAPNGQYLVSTDVSPHPFALEINYQRDISKQQLLEVTEEQWQKLGFPKSSRQQWITQLSVIFPSIKNGDELTYITDGDKGQIIYRQAGTKTQKMVGEITDERMNDAFLSIWLSPKTEFPKLRKQLIGQVRP